MITLAWHFTDGMKYRCGKPLVVGETYVYRGELELCRSGLHASVRAIDALGYAPGNTVSLVRCEGKTVHGGDKLVCQRRTPIFTIDATKVLMQYARGCALDVLHLWSPPDVVKQYLETGDDSIRAAAWAAARAAGADAARDAARDAAWAAARAAAWAAVGEVVGAAPGKTLESMLLSAMQDDGFDVEGLL
jgi:hypothetical protein